MLDLQPDKNTSVFLDGDLSHAETQSAGGPRSVAATIDRSGWKRVRLGEVLKVCHGKCQHTVETKTGKYPILATSGEIGRTNTYLYDKPSVLIGRKGTIDKPQYIDIPFWTIDTLFYTKIAEGYNPKFLYYLCLTIDWVSMNEASGVPSLSANRIESFEIAIPDINEQDKIVHAMSSIDKHILALEAIISKYEAIRKATVNLLLKPGEDCPSVRLGDVAKIFRGGSPRPIQNYITEESTGINWIKIGDVATDAKYIKHTAEKIKPTGVQMSRQVKAGDFILSNSMSFGRPYILKIDGCIHDGWLAIQDYQETFDVDYLYYLLGSDFVLAQYQTNAAGSSVKNLNKEIVSNIILPQTPIPEQHMIANQIATIDNALNDCRAQLAKAQNLKNGLMSYFFG